MTTHISDDVRDFVSTWSDGDYMIEPTQTGRYGASKDATYVVIRNGRIISHYQSLWCGDRKEGETYRQHRNGERRAYLPRFERTAVDKCSEWSEFLERSNAQVGTDDILEFFP